MSSQFAFWSAGGETSLDILLLLCTRHHRLVHEGGFSIAKDYLDRWYFRRSDGIAVPQCGYRLEDILDDVNVDDASLIECPSAEGFLSKWHKKNNPKGMSALPPTVAERGPPAYLM